MSTHTRSRDWIATAIQKPGSFSEAARRHGRTTAAFAEKEKDAPGKLGRRARLAAELLAFREKKKNG